MNGEDLETTQEYLKKKRMQKKMCQIPNNSINKPKKNKEKQAKNNKKSPKSSLQSQHRTQNWYNKNTKSQCRSTRTHKKNNKKTNNKKTAERN